METEIRQKMNALNLEIDEVRAKMSKLSDDLARLTYGDAGFEELSHEKVMRLLNDGKVLETPWDNFIFKDFNTQKIREINIHKEQDSFEVRLYNSQKDIKETNWIKEAKNPEMIKLLYSIRELEI
jgi:hypothetical protein